MGITSRIGTWAQARAGRASAAPQLLTALGGLATHLGQQLLAKQHEAVTDELEGHRAALTLANHDLAAAHEELGRYRVTFGPLSPTEPANSSAADPWAPSDGTEPLLHESGGDG